MNKSTKSFLSRWLPVLLWAALIYWLSNESNPYKYISAPVRIWLKNNRLFDYRMWEISGLLMHLTLFAVLAILIIRVLAWQKRPRFAHFFFAFILAVLYAVSDEIHQSYVPDRAFEVLDLSLNTSGAFLGVLASTLWHTRRAKRLIPVVNQEEPPTN